MPAKNHLTMAARRDSRIRREGAKEGWHIHYNCSVTQWIFQKTKKGGLQDRHKPGQCSGITEVFWLITKRFSVQITIATIQRFLRMALHCVTVRARKVFSINKIVFTRSLCDTFLILHKLFTHSVKTSLFPQLCNIVQQRWHARLAQRDTAVPSKKLTSYVQIMTNYQ